MSPSLESKRKQARPEETCTHTQSQRPIRCHCQWTTDPLCVWVFSVCEVLLAPVLLHISCVSFISGELHQWDLMSKAMSVYISRQDLTAPAPFHTRLWCFYSAVGAQLGVCLCHSFNISSHQLVYQRKQENTEHLFKPVWEWICFQNIQVLELLSSEMCRKCIFSLIYLLSNCKTRKYSYSKSTSSK